MTARSQDFVQSIGINTHVTFWGLPVSNLNYIQSDLAYLGVGTIRDNNSQHVTDVANQYKTLAANGTKIQLVWYSEPIEQFIDMVLQIEQAYPGSIAGVEGPNEADAASFSYKGLTGIPAANAAQKDLFAAMNANPLLANIPVLMWPLASQIWSPDNQNAVGNMTAWTDYGNFHDYYHGDYSTPLFQQLPAYIASEQTITGSDPLISTEMGWSTATSSPDHYGTNQDVQGKLILSLLLDHYKAGIQKSYIYGLIEDSADPTGNSQLWSHWGLFTTNNTPKEAAGDLRNLISILKDTGSTATTFTAGTLPYTITNLPASGQHFLMGKSSGAFDIAVWNEPPLWNAATGQQNVIAPTSVVVNLGQTFQTVEVFDPTVGASPVQTLSNVNAVTLGLTDHPMIVEVKAGSGTPPPDPPPPPPPPPDPPPPTVDTHQLALVLAGDKYRGEAQFIAKLDGQQVGQGTVTALEHSGKTNTFNFSGQWAAGVHDAEVSFINDLSGRMASQDRNLYVHDVRYDGASYLDHTVPMLTNSTVHFSVGL